MLGHLISLKKHLKPLSVFMFCQVCFTLLWICIQPPNTTNGTSYSQIETEEWINTVVPVYILIITAVGVGLNVFVLIQRLSGSVAEIHLSNLAADELILKAIVCPSVCLTVLSV